MDRKQKRLRDIWERILKIQQFLDGVSYETADEKTQAAVNMYLQVISEQVRQLKEDREAGRLEAGFTLAHEQQIISLRNRISHHYASLDETIVAQIVHIHLPFLANEIEQWLEKTPDTDTTAEDFWE